MGTLLSYFSFRLIYRIVPGYVAVRGEADTNAFVTVNERPAFRLGEYFHGGDYADNTASNVWADLEIYAAINPPGTNVSDTVYAVTSSVFVTKNPEQFTYDADGNMTSDGRFTYTWNADNRLICASNGEVVVTYAYDHRGRMVKKTLCASASTAPLREIHYTWDDWNIIRETLVTRHSSLVTDNVWGLDLDGTLQGAGGVGGLLAVIRDDGVYLPCYDANGNITEYISTNGDVVAHYDYSPFGEQLISSGPLAATFTHRFSTKPWCADTGLVEYQMRKYRPDIGRWMSRDPIGELGGMHQYAFNNNIIDSYYDILGLKPNVSRCSEERSCKDNILSLSDGVHLSAMRYAELFNPTFLREAIEDALLPPERQYKKGRTDLRGREAWDGHKIQYEGSLNHVKNCIEVVINQLANDKCKCCDADKTLQLMVDVESLIDIMERNPPTIPTDGMLPIVPTLPEISPVDIAKRPLVNWRKIGWYTVGGIAVAGTATLLIVPFDGPLGETACGALATSAFAKAATTAISSMVFHFSPMNPTLPIMAY